MGGIARFGSWRALAVCAAGAAASALAILVFDIRSHGVFMLVLLTVHGFFANAVQSPLYALAAFLYPTPVRATGTATAAAFGRTRAICAGFSGGFVTSISAYFILLGVSMLLVLLALACIRRHIPSMRLLRQHPSVMASGRM